LRTRYPNDPTIRYLDRKGLPLTRANYIAAGHDPDQEWTAEHEAALPRELRS